MSTPGPGMPAPSGPPKTPKPPAGGGGAAGSGDAPKEGKTPKDGNAPKQSVAKKAVNFAIEKGLIALGVPPEIARRLAPIIAKAIAIMLSFMFLILFGFVGLTAGSDGAKDTAAYQSLDERARRVIEEVSTQYRLPSRLLAAVATAQTQFGTVNPYDNSSRTAATAGTSLYPTLEPPIGDENVKGQGLGPYLIRKDAVKDANIDPQSWQAATEFLAKRLAEARDDLVVGGLPEPSTPAEADSFWSKAVAKLPLVDPLGGAAGCTAPTEDLGNAIRSIWECEARNNGVALTVVTEENGAIRIYRMNSEDSTATLIQEALGVAWLRGVSRGAKSWEDIRDLSCSSSATTAGVFPLTKSLAKKYGLADRCDTAGNISAAAQAVIDDANIAIAEELTRSGTYVPATAGWRVLGDTLGNSSVQRRFATGGPGRPYSPSSACSQLISVWVAQLGASAFTPTFSKLAGPHSDADLQAAWSAFNNVVGGAPSSDPRCVDSRTQTQPAPADFVLYAAYLAQATATELAEGSTGLTGVAAPAIVGLQVLAEAKGASAAPVEARWSDTAAMQRLSPDLITVEFPFVQPSNDSSGLIGIGQRVVGIAIALGGLVGDDNRAGTNPFSGGGGMFGDVGGIGISIEREDPNKKPVMPTSSGLAALSCGQNNGQRYGLPLLGQRWETMCSSAKQDGVTLGIVSSWRSQADQQRLYDTYKNNPNARVAAPGSSPHQKGQAVDINLGSSDGIGGNTAPQYAWLHTIVGCFDIAEKSYTTLSKAYLNTEYVAAMEGGRSPCGAGTYPIKRAQTYGLVPLCILHANSGYETWGSRDVILCDSRTVIIGSASRQIREPWHFDIGVIAVSTASSAPLTIEGCATPPIIDATNKQSVAQGVRSIWYCELAQNGFATMPTRNGPGSYVASEWFKNFAEQVASEAVLVAFCESGFNAGSGATSTYKGVFQMGDGELRSGGADPRLWADAAVNIRAAARLWLQTYQTANTLEGWSRWAVVNTQWYAPKGNSIQVPVIGRFIARVPSPQAGTASGQPLPNWAVDPSKHWGPSGSCGNTLGMGKQMPDAS